jgi:hypothetical protein
MKIQSQEWKSGRIYTLDELRPIMSQYLERNCMQERHTLEELYGCEGCLRARMYATEIGPYESHGFNLSVTVVMRWIYQLGVIYAALDKGHDRKRGPVWLRDFSIKCRRPVRDRAWTCELRLVSKIERAKMTFYRGTFDVCDRAFFGEATCAVPPARH